MTVGRSWRCSTPNLTRSVKIHPALISSPRSCKLKSQSSTTTWLTTSLLASTSVALHNLRYATMSGTSCLAVRATPFATYVAHDCFLFLPGCLFVLGRSMAAVCPSLPGPEVPVKCGVKLCLPSICGLVSLRTQAHPCLLAVVSLHGTILQQQAGCGCSEPGNDVMTKHACIAKHALQSMRFQCILNVADSKSAIHLQMTRLSIQCATHAHNLTFSACTSGPIMIQVERTLCQLR